MGLFNISSKYNQLERILLDSCSLTWSVSMGLGDSMARKAVKQALDEAIKESKDDGTYYLPRNFGDIIVGKIEVADPAIKECAEIIRKNIPKKKKEGVKDEDICWWWNLNEIERRIMSKEDEIARMAMFINEYEKYKEFPRDKATNKAGAKVRKFHPIYGDPDIKTFGTGDDRPLPYELKNRINMYIERRSIDKDELKKDIEESSSFNALIRREIRDGRV